MARANDDAGAKVVVREKPCCWAARARHEVECASDADMKSLS